jgi:hypothetical protein
MSDTDKADKTGKPDKTGEKLVASIRKTRAGAAKKTTAGKTSTTSTAAASARKKAATRPRTAPKAEKKVPQVPGSTDAYQYGRRIWPD